MKERIKGDEFLILFQNELDDSSVYDLRKRGKMYNFGLGKRGRLQYSFGIGKRTLIDTDSRYRYKTKHCSLLQMKFTR